MKVFTCAVSAALLFTAAAERVAAQSTGKLDLGSTESFAKSLAVKAAIGSVGSGSTLEVTVAPGTTLDLDVNVERFSAADDKTFIGSIAGKPNSSFYIHVDGDELVGNIILDKDGDEAYRYGSDSRGGAFVETVGLDDVLCVRYDEAPMAVSAGIVGAAPQISQAALRLESLPGAATCVLLDVDGEYVAGTLWNNGNPVNAAPSGMSDGEVQEMWELVSEDFKPFSVNITTDEGVFNRYPRNRRMRCIVTPTKTVAPKAGGVAYLRSFSWDDDTPCWVFMTSPKAGGEAASHEIGHTIGLSHDGRTYPEEGYYRGQGSWAPIMGVGYYEPISQWSRGEYNNANQKQDDLSIMEGYIPFRNDDHSNGIQGATTINYGSDGGVTLTRGIIGRTNDVDYFRITVGTGRTILNVNVADRHANLETSVRLFEGRSGRQIGTFNGGDQNTQVVADLDAGTYYIAVDGVGAGNPRTTGFSDYASLGAYRITGRVPVGGGGGGGGYQDIATIYLDCDYGRTSVALPVGNYDLDDLAARGMPNDNMSSLKVQSGYEVVFYLDAGFSGRAGVARGNVSCLVDADWNDKASSVRVRRSTAGDNYVSSTKIEAETHSAMNGIRVENCSEGGENVGYIDAGDWMVFNNVQFQRAGKYRVEYRVASPTGGGKLSLDANEGATVFGSVRIPNTGGWQNWTTVSHVIDAQAGTYNLGVFASTGSWNINWLSISPVGSDAVENRSEEEIVESATLQNVDVLKVYPNPVSSELTLQVSPEWENSRVTLYNMQGAKVREIAYSSTINVESLPEGVYSVEVLKEDRRLVTRFVKN